MHLKATDDLAGDSLTWDKLKRAFLSIHLNVQVYKNETLSHHDASLDRAYVHRELYNEVQLKSRIGARIAPAKREHNPGNRRRANIYINFQSSDRSRPRHVHAIRPRWSLLPSPTVEVAIGCFPPQEGLAFSRAQGRRGGGLPCQSMARHRMGTP